MYGILNIELIEEIDGWGWDFHNVRHQISGFKGEQINVPINSFGGDVLEGFSIYNILLGHPAKVHAHIVTYAMSMGTVIAMAADVVTMAENGYFMIHNPWGGEIGESDDLRRTADVLDKMTTDIVKVYQRKTGLSDSELRKMMNETTWLTAKEAKELGFVDTLTKGATLSASFNPDDLNKYKNIPKNLMSNKNNKPSTKAGANLAEVLEGWIEMRTDDDMSRGDIIREMGDAAGISDSAVRQILDGEINCPPIERLEGFAGYFDRSIDDLIGAAENDGCEYDSEEAAQNKGGWINRIVAVINNTFGVNLPTGANEATLIAELKTIPQQMSDGLDSRIVALENKIGNIKPSTEPAIDVETFTNRMTAMESKLDAFNAKVTELETANADLKAAKLAAEKKAAELKGKIKDGHTADESKVVKKFNNTGMVQLEVKMKSRN